jgi:hypothetical protein
MLKPHQRLPDVAEVRYEQQYSGRRVLGVPSPWLDSSRGLVKSLRLYSVIGVDMTRRGRHLLDPLRASPIFRQSIPNLLDLNIWTPGGSPRNLKLGSLPRHVYAMFFASTTACTVQTQRGQRRRRSLERKAE